MQVVFLWPPYLEKMISDKNMETVVLYRGIKDVRYYLEAF